MNLLLENVIFMISSKMTTNGFLIKDIIIICLIFESNIATHALCVWLKYHTT